MDKNSFLYLFHLIYGQRCPGCGGWIEPSDGCVLCEKCEVKWNMERAAVFKNKNKNKKSDAESNIPAFHSFTFLTYYDTLRGGVSKNMLLYLKKHYIRAICGFLGDRLAEELLNKYGRAPSEAVVVNVPRSKKSIREYGHDQAELIARRTALKLGLSYCGAVSRKDRSRAADKAQKTLSRRERLVNAEDAYYIKEQKLTEIFGRRCILIDDICTSGATLKACAELLVSGGAKYVDCAVISKTI